MYPQLFNQASRLAPMLSRILSRGGSFASPLWKASQIDVPSIDAKPVPPQAPNMPSPPISSDNSTTPTNVSAAPPMLPPWMQGAQWMNPAASAPMPASPAAGSPMTPGVSAGVPMPQARPAEAPQPPPDTSFFMRNALMQQDPNGGGFIDPTGAASVRGPDLIAKMMTYLHNKAST